MTDNAHATPSCTASRTLPPSWTSGWHKQSPPFPLSTPASLPAAHTRCQWPLSSIIYHSVNVLRLQFIIQPPLLPLPPPPPPFCFSLPPRTYFTGSSFVIFLYLVALFAAAPLRLKAKAALGAEKRMENQFLTSGCYFSCQRFKAVAGAIKTKREREGERGRGELEAEVREKLRIELGKIAINVDLKSLPAIIGNN